ncbi:MAG TPA: cytochrome c-type biogenesis protein CcmH [Bryobacteraceae bacterium]|nr:cytochrome c-type biogenesis protein CcmH [Bryobacteraceae bacterium]
MARWKRIVLLAAVAGLLIGQDGTALVTPPVRRVGMRLACLCASCRNTVGDCAMLECGYCKPARLKIAAMQAAGKSDDEIVAAFVKENGLQALASPPTSGFSLLAWVMPFVAIAAGLLAIVWFVKRFGARRAAAGVPELDEETLRRYQEQIEKDVAKLE